MSPASEGAWFLSHDYPTRRPENSSSKFKSLNNKNVLKCFLIFFKKSVKLKIKKCWPYDRIYMKSCWVYHLNLICNGCIDHSLDIQLRYNHTLMYYDKAILYVRITPSVIYWRKKKRIDNISTPQRLLFYLFILNYRFALYGIYFWTNFENFTDNQKC